jgi:hypothetical protein
MIKTKLIRMYLKFIWATPFERVMVERLFSKPLEYYVEIKG